MTDRKTCSRCGETKPLSQFHRKANRLDGRQSQCKTCRAKTPVPRRICDECGAWRQNSAYKRGATTCNACVRKLAGLRTPADQLFGGKAGSAWLRKSIV